MRKIIIAGILIIILVVGIPVLTGLILGGKNVRGEDWNGRAEIPETVKVWREDMQETVEVDFEEYVACVTACEMPSEFEEEALKAQSVAARTYAVSKIARSAGSPGQAHPDAPLCDTTHCQVYRSEEELKESHEEGWYEYGFEKIKKASEQTAGQLLYYDGKLVTQPLFFSSSGGRTENSDDVFTGSYPYLVSVESPYEENATHKGEEKKFTLKQVKNALSEAYPDRAPGEITPENTKILSRTEGGRVALMEAGGSVFKGTEIRSALSLSSALFSVAFEGSGKEETACLVFTSDGSGHGVGMSQYGADGMAKNGADYKDILKHYYTGTEVC